LGITQLQVKELAKECGFEIVGVASALPSGDLARFEQWRAAGMAGEMGYMTDRRGDIRADPRNLLPEARTMLCVGKLYNRRPPSRHKHSASGRISRYARGHDYHDVLRKSLENLVAHIRQHHNEPFQYRICVDTAPLLERSYARAAGLGWIGKNTCLINQQQGSWFFLGELLLSIPLETDTPVPSRCGTCTRCIDACPTQALVPVKAGEFALDARLCISYLTIEKRGEIDPGLATQMENHIFGCDICQEVCPWNRRAPFAVDDSAPEPVTDLERLSGLTEDEFRTLFRRSPVWRTRYQGFLRNVATALGNSHNPRLQEPLRKLAFHADPVVARAASSAIAHFATPTSEAPTHALASE